MIIDLTIIIVNYKSWSKLKNCIKSIQNQSHINTPSNTSLNIFRPSNTVLNLNDIPFSANDKINLKIGEGQ